MKRNFLKSVALAAPFIAAAAGGACSSGGDSGTFLGGGTSSGGTGTSTAGTGTSTAGTGTSTAGTGTSTGGTGTSTAGTSSTGGTGTGTGGSAPGGSGGASTGGTSAGSAAGGSAGSGGGGACETVDCIAGGKNTNMDSLTSAFIMFGCYGKQQQDCITIPGGMTCPNQDTNLPFEKQGISFKQSFKVGGVAGKKYLLSITVNGISEAKYYENGMRFAGNGDPADPNATNGTDTFYTGGDPVNYENYNIYKVTTLDGTGTEIQHYYLNSFPKTNTAYEAHQTFPIAFTHDITVEGGGTVELLQADRNCHAIDNCGPGYRVAQCNDTDGRSVPNEPNLKLPASYLGTPIDTLNPHGGASQPFHSQVIHVVASAVKPM